MEMNGHGDRREYQRASISNDAAYSFDGATWTPFEIADISPGGLSMQCPSDFEAGVKLRFKISLYGLSADFEFQTEGAIFNKFATRSFFIYGVSFINMPHHIKIRIDEMIRQTRPRDYLL